MAPPNDRNNIEKLLYSYSVVTSSISAGGTDTQSVNIEADSDFVITKSTYFATDGAGASQTHNSRIIPLVTVQITDTGSGRNLLDSTQPISNVFGTGEQPFIWPVAQTVRANSVIRFAFTSEEATASRKIWLSLIGFKLYRY